MRILTLVILLSVAVQALAAPIHDAAVKGDLAKVKALIAKDPKLVSAKDGNGATPLHFAVAGGQKAVVEYLLSKKADVNARKNDGVTPLHIAASLGRLEIAKIILARGANKKASDSKGRTPLTLAGEKGHVDMIDLLTGKASTPKLGVKVVSIPKDAVVLRAGKKMAGVKAGSELKIGDVIESGKTGDLVIHIGDVSAIRLKPGAKLKLTKLTLTGDLDIRTDLQAGDALARVRALTGQSRFQMASPGAVVAVRGTAFAVKVKGEESTVIVGEGKVGVWLPSDPAQQVEVLDGEMVTAGKGALPQPEPVSAAEAGIVQEMLQEPMPSQNGEAAATILGPKDGEPMVLIPAGEFLMGNDAGNDDEKPAKKVYVSAFRMDVHEVTYEQYVRFLNDVKPDDAQRKEWMRLDGEPQAEFKTGFYYGPKISFDGQRFVAKPEFARYPVAWVTWKGADAYAKWAGESLPSEAQWERAARGGKDGQTHSWGEGTPPPGSGSFTDESFKRQWPKLSTIAGYDDGYTFASPVCSFKPNAFGLFDMEGNLMEMCLDVYAADWYGRMPDRDPVNTTGSGSHVSRGNNGSSFGKPEDVLWSTRLSARIPNSENWDNVGFRCVSPAK
jgi:sulfatase modifying factor 1